MKPLALALAAVALAAPAKAEPLRFGVIEIDTVGCAEQEDAYRFVRLMAAGDKIAAARFLAQNAPACLSLRGGSKVEIERETALRFRMTCVRPVGEPRCRWIASDLVATP